MPKAYQCPACRNEVDGGATVCSNPACRRELAFCSWCRDIAGYVLVEESKGRFGRDRYRCERCERIGVKCVTWVAGGYCNGLARVGGRLGPPFCARCSERAFEMGRHVVGWTIAGALGGLLRRRR